MIWEAVAGAYYSAWTILSTDPRPASYLLLVLLVWFLERKYPAIPQQKFLSIGFFQDGLWYGMHLLFKVIFYGIWIKFLHGLYQTYFSFLTVTGAAQWDHWHRAILAILLVDFLAWLHHLIRHKVGLFWRFHMVHHSQSKMNLFTDARVHPVDSLIAKTLVFIPLFMFENAFPAMLAFATFLSCYTKFYHANIRMNFGLLRYVLVTPQSHRVHHSFDASHQDKNFGVFLCIWDRIFHTHFDPAEVFPETGIQDEKFPLESKFGLFSMLGSAIKQLIYPFRPSRNRVPHS